jgi:hypothetical protein
LKNEITRRRICYNAKQIGNLFLYVLFTNIGTSLKISQISEGWAELFCHVEISLGKKSYFVICVSLLLVKKQHRRAEFSLRRCDRLNVMERFYGERSPIFIGAACC